MSTYFDGCVMAYRDCEDFTKEMANRLPPELQFLRPQFIELSTSFGNRANYILRLARSRQGVKE